MTSPLSDPGSFRDPGGRVFLDGDRVLRAVYAESAQDYEAARDSGLLEELIAAGALVESRELAPASVQLPGEPTHVLEHPRLPFISYPYEWPFALHKKAALFHLDLLLRGLDRGFAMSDATAYNVQFVGTEPKFIDHLSFQPYQDGEIWAGHRQFCMQFLNPLLLWSRLGLSPNAWFRGALEGIAPEDLARLLRRRDNLSWTILSHVTAQAAAERRAKVGPSGSGTRRAKLPRPSFVAMLQGLRGFIAKSELPRQRTVWDTYATDNSYSGNEAGVKAEFVREMVAAVQPRMLFDLGCNSGDYSLAALDAGANYVVGFDFDFGALERAAERSEQGRLPFLPLWLDATNPSPGQGWNEQERKGFSDRAKADAVLALAFIHHLAIARNIPLGMAVDWIMSRAPVGVIEFPPKSDSMVRQLLSNRKDIFPAYSEPAFLAEVEARGRVVKTRQLSPGGRLLVWYDRRPT